MFLTDLFAAAVPVVPFALFTLAAADVSLAVTFELCTFVQYVLLSSPGSASTMAYDTPPT